MTLKNIVRKRSIIALSIAASLSTTPAMAKDRHDDEDDRFRRIATFPVYLNTDINNVTVAEIVAASSDGTLLIYTDSQTENLGFVDITDPAHPAAAGIVPVGGEPTSVAVHGNYALVAVNTSHSFVAPSGNLQIIDITSRKLVTHFDLGGQPDSVAISPDGRFAAIAVENERDEDLGDGAPPQPPAGYLLIVDMTGEPTDWTLRNVDLTGIANLYPEDPEPEYVTINEDNVAVVTLQENNHIVLVDLASGDILNDFSAGHVDLTQVDDTENDLIELNGSLQAVPREPDGVTWITKDRFATADEGDLFGGSRGYTLYNTQGDITYTAGNEIEHEVVRHGHYPEGRSENKGNEPENVTFGRYGRNRYLFVGSERSSVVLVYKIGDKGHKSPRLVQILPAAVKPEGLLALPQRNLFIAAGEEDARGDKIRAGLSIYRYGEEANYPAIVSDKRRDGTPIPWGALSGLAMDPNHKHSAYTVHDSFYQKSRIYKLDIEKEPARIRREIVLNDMMGRLAAVDPDLVNADGTVNLDLEGIATSGKGFWLVSEGSGTVGDANRPFKSLNLLLRVGKKGLIKKVITLPEAVNARQLRFGLEGVASVSSDEGELVYVAFQRAWAGDRENHVRIGRYDTASGEWTFLYYPLEAPQSAYGGWVGLSELTYLGNDSFAVIERDNQGGPDAAIKRIYSFSVAGLTPTADNGGQPEFPVVAKRLARDLMPELKGTGGYVLEKIEGMALSRDGEVLIVNDNDGVDDSNGETQLFRLDGVFEDDD